MSICMPTYVHACIHVCVHTYLSISISISIYTTILKQIEYAVYKEDVRVLSKHHIISYLLQDGCNHMTVSIA